MSDNKIKHLLVTASKTDAIAQNKWRIENREQLREQRKKELKELMEKDKTMSNNKQSSVEWFIDQLEEKGKAYAETVGVRTVNICIDVSEYMELKQQAKAMHREEIEDAHGVQYDYSYSQIDPKKVTGEQYYNETYGY